MGWRVKLGVAAALGGVLATAVIVLFAASGSSPADSTADARQALAVREAQTLLAGLALPARAPRHAGIAGASASPASVGAGAVAGLGRAISADVAQRASTVTVNGDPAAVRAYIVAHAPPGTRVTDGGLRLVARRLPRALAAATVTLTLTPAGPHTTLVHAVAQARWLVARSDAERVPSAARRLVITRGRPGRRPGIVITVSGARARRIAALLDRLATVQPGEVYHCPAAIVGLPRVTFTFRARAGGPALAQASEDADVVSPTTACDAMRFSVGGRVRAPLLGGARLLREVSALLGRRLWLAPYAA